MPEYKNDNPLLEKNPETNNELPKIDIENIANELENIFSATDGKDASRMVQPVLYELMLKKGFQIPRDTKIIDDVFHKILIHCKATGDSDLKKVFLKKGNPNYVNPDNHTPAEQKQSTIDTFPTEPIIDKEALQRMMPDAWHHELENKPPSSSREDD